MPRMTVFISTLTSVPSPANQQSCFTVTASSGHVHVKALRLQSFCPSRLRR